MFDDDGNTILEPAHSTTSSTLEDLIPDLPPITPLEVVFERVTVRGPQHAGGSMSGSGESPRIFEVWTQKSLYVVDASFRCIAVNDRETGQPDPSHPLVGARLGGGQRRYGKTMHQTRPLPVPGTEAVFEVASAGGAQARIKLTSRVERVVLRIRVITLVLENENAWDDVTNALLHPGFDSLFED